MNRNENSVLIGNGFDIQVGGDDYQNKWIIVRLLAKAKMGKYDMLFTEREGDIPRITGDDIVEFFRNMVAIANKARKNEYKDLAKSYEYKDLKEALKDFVQNHKDQIKSVEEVGMEDWLLIFLLFLIELRDMTGQYKLLKQGFERMVLDAIYCEGHIRELHVKMNTSSKKFFNSFDNIFTLNYDDTIEKLTKRAVFHLHGDFKTKHPSENPKNAHGYLRLQNGQNVWFPQQLKHCNCTAILDFSGDRKYNYATKLTNTFLEFEKIKREVKKDESVLGNILDRLPIEQRQIFSLGVEKDLYLGHNYHFQDFEQITGTLKIIGLAPQNDSHIFSCINHSSIKNVEFYHYFGNKCDNEIKSEIESICLPINKPYVIKNVQEIWDEIEICKPAKNNVFLVKEQLQIVNAPYRHKPISMKDILWQLNAIPTITRKVIVEMLAFEFSKDKYHTTPKTEKELRTCFIEFGNTLEVSALSPQTLYCIYLTERQRIIEGGHGGNK